MTEEIRLISLELNNYRQFYGLQQVHFSSREEGFTTVVGANGEGKSNLLNSINWCFYKIEPHGRKDQNNEAAPIINTKYITEVEKGNIARMSVKVLLQKGNEQYRISRVMTILKHTLEYDIYQGHQQIRITRHAEERVPVGCEIIPEQSTFQIMKKGEHELDFRDVLTAEKIDPRTKMEQILPHDLSSFFLLDGDFLEHFWGSPKSVRNGIEQISQINLLSNVKECVDSLVIPSTKGYGREIDTLTKQCQLLMWNENSRDEDGNETFSEEERWNSVPPTEPEFYHRSGKPRISELTEDIAKMEDRLKSISREIGNVNVANVKYLKKQYDDIYKKLEQEKSRKKSFEITYCNNLVTKSPFLFLKGAIEKSIEIVEKHQKRGELPNETKKTFTSDLLEQNKCICHTDLTSNKNNGKETNSFRIHVEEIRDAAAGDVDLDVAVRMRYSFKHKLLDDYEAFLKTNFTNPRKELSDSTIAYDDYNRELKGITSKLEGAGDDKTTELIKEQDYLLTLIKDAEKKIYDIDLILRNNTVKLTEHKIMLSKLTDKNKVAAKLSHEIKIWEKTANYLAKIYDELKEEIRTDVQVKTWKNFIELLDNPKEFTKFMIQPNYAVSLLGQTSFNMISDISQGQALLLTLSFVAALRDATGYKFPLVIDSPLGKIDSSITYNIGSALPDYEKGEQIIFLATDKEYAAEIPPDPEKPERETIPFGVLLAKKINVKLFRIKKGNDGNSTISPAKLILNKSEKWEVVHNV